MDDELRVRVSNGVAHANRELQAARKGPPRSEELPSWRGAMSG